MSTSSATAAPEQLLYQERVDGHECRFWYASYKSRLRAVVEKLVSGRYPVHNGNTHWGGYLIALPGGSPDTEISAFTREKFWMPLCGRSSIPSPQLSQAELFVATHVPDNYTDPALHKSEHGVGFSALLPRDMHPEFDPSIPDSIAGLGPWRSLEIADEVSSPALATMLGRFPRERAKSSGFDSLYFYTKLPEDGILPTDWRGSPCRALAVLPYCSHILTAEGTRRPLQMVLELSLKDVVVSDYWSNL